MRSCVWIKTSVLCVLVTWSYAGQNFDDWCDGPFGRDRAKVIATNNKGSVDCMFNYGANGFVEQALGKPNLVTGLCWRKAMSRVWPWTRFVSWMMLLLIAYITRFGGWAHSCDLAARFQWLKTLGGVSWMLFLSSGQFPGAWQKKYQLGRQCDIYARDLYLICKSNGSIGQQTCWCSLVAAVLWAYAWIWSTDELRWNLRWVMAPIKSLVRCWLMTLVAAGLGWWSSLAFGLVYLGCTPAERESMSAFLSDFSRAILKVILSFAPMSAQAKTWGMFLYRTSFEPLSHGASR